MMVVSFKTVDIKFLGVEAGKGEEDSFFNGDGTGKPLGSGNAAGDEDTFCV